MPANSVLKRTRLERRLQAYFRFIFGHFGAEAELDGATLEVDAVEADGLALEEPVLDFFLDFFFDGGVGSVSSTMIFFGG